MGAGRVGGGETVVDVKNYFACMQNADAQYLKVYVRTYAKWFNEYR